MENSSSKMEAMKPVLLKVGIPLAITFVGCVFTKIKTRKSSQKIDSRETRRDECDFQKRDEFLGLRRRIEEIQVRELEIEKKFLQYQGLKDQEMVLIELQNKFLVEMNRVEFLGREISLLESENRRFERVSVEFLKLARFFELSGLENEKLRTRVKTRLARSKELYRVLRKQSLRIGFLENEISKNQESIEAKDGCFRLMEDEIMKLKIVIEILQDEKTQLSNKLRVSQESSISKVEEETTKDEADLTWRNACLKHKSMRKNQEEEEEENEVNENYGGIEEIGRFGSYNGLKRCNQFRVGSRRRRLISKFKRWVEGSEKGKHSLEDENENENEEEERGNQYFPRRRSDSDRVDESCFLSNKSCSSV